MPVEAARRVGGPALAGALSGAALSGAALSAAALSAAALTATLVLAAPAGPAGAVHSRQTKTIQVSTAKVAHVGTVLTTGAGLTLYRFTGNAPGMSTCAGSCAKVWPPYLAAKGEHIAGPRGVKGLSVINVGSGQWQVAFHNVALYHFEGDTKKGQAKGQGVIGKWFAVLKSGIPATAAAASAPPSSSNSTPSSTPTSGSTTAPTSSPSHPVTPLPAAPHPVTTPPPAPAASPTPVTQAPAPTPTPTTAPPPPPPPPPPPTTTTTVPGGGGISF